MSAVHEIKHEAHGQHANKAQGKAECFICIKAALSALFDVQQARSCFNCFEELTHEHLVRAYPFQSITRPSTLSSWVRRFWMISNVNASVSRLILAELTWICHLVSLFTICFSHLMVLYCNIALQKHFRCQLYDKYIFALILPCKVL